MEALFLLGLGSMNKPIKSLAICLFIWISISSTMMVEPLRKAPRIQKNKLIPFVFLGYIVVSVGGVNSLTAGIIAICIAFITVFQRQEIAEEVREHE